MRREGLCVLRAPLPAALLRGAVPPRRPALDDREDVMKRVDWSWSQTATAIARQLGVTPNSVGQQRSRSNGEIAATLGVHLNVVSRHRKRRK